MGNERDKEREYEKKPPQSEWKLDEWSGLDAEDRVYYFDKLTPVTPGYYQPNSVTKSALGFIEERDFLSSPDSNTTQTKQQQSPQNKQGQKPQPTNSPPKKQNWLQRMFGGDRQQEPSPEQIEAKKQFDSYSVPGLQPDVYISQLQLQRQIAQKNGANAKQLKQIDEAITNAEQLLGITEQTPQGTAIPLTATLTTTAEGQTVPLQLYLKPAFDGGWEIVDLTNPDKGSARTYRGSVRRSGRQAMDVTGEAAKQLAIDRAWENYVKNNPHPEGELVADFSLNKEAGSNIKQGHSTGISELQQVRQWASRVGLVTGVVGLGMLLTPGLQGGGALLLTSAVAGGVAGGSGMLDRTQYGNFQWDAQTFLDLTDIAAGLAVGAGAAIKVGAKSASITQLGKNTVLISEGVETGTDVAAGTIISAQHYRRIEEIRNSGLPEDQKQAQIKQELASAAATGGLLLIGGVATTRGGRARDFEFKADGIATLNRGTRNSDELNKWRKIGLSETEITELNNPNITPAQKNALLAKNDAVYKQLYQQFGEEGLSTLNGRLGVDGFKKIHQVSGNDGLKTVADVIELEKQGKIKNLDDWISFFNRGNKSNENIQNLLVELQEANRVSYGIRDGEVVNIGGDARAATNAAGKQDSSFDITVENIQTNKVTRNIEVTTVKQLVKRADDLNQGIIHAIDKRSNATSGTVEATIQIEFNKEFSRPGSRKRYINESGSYVDVERDGNSFNSGNILAEVKDNLIEFEASPDFQKRIKENPNVNLIDRVNVTKIDGSLLGTIIKENGEWKLKM